MSADVDAAWGTWITAYLAWPHGGMPRSINDPEASAFRAGWDAAIRAEAGATIRHLEERLAEYMLENAALRAEGLDVCKRLLDAQETKLAALREAADRLLVALEHEGLLLHRPWTTETAEALIALRAALAATPAEEAADKP